MSAIAEDALVVGHQCRLGRPPVETLLTRPGPVILVALVASGEGRWASVATHPRAGQAIRTSLVQKLVEGSTNLIEDKDSAQVIGSVALVSWELAGKMASSVDTHLLMSGSMDMKRNGSEPLHFLEHRILGAAILSTPVDMPCPAKWKETSGMWPTVLCPDTETTLATRICHPHGWA